jgi:hypothetical protein
MVSVCVYLYYLYMMHGVYVRAYGHAATHADTASERWLLGGLALSKAI